MTGNPSAFAVSASIAEGHAHFRSGRLREAEQSYRHALTLDPGQPEALAFLGMIAGQAGRLRDAIALFERALKRTPRNADIHHNLGETWRHLGENAKALACFERATACNPDHIEAFRCGAEVAIAEAARREAAQRWGDAAHYKQLAAKLLIAAGQRMRDSGDRVGAVEVLRRATELDPNNADAWTQFGETLLNTSPSQAIPVLRRAVKLDPHAGLAHSLLCTALSWLYREDEARTASKIARAAVPAYVETQPILDVFESFPLYAGGDMEQIFAAHKAWGDAQISRQRTPPMAFKNNRDPERRLRIGYVSPDLRVHSVSSFFEPLLRAHRREEFDVICYSGVRLLAEDETTARLKALASLWRAIPPSVDDETFRRQVRSDRIDILIDLAGHTRDSRISGFAVKPAPVTVTWLGYPTTTGLTTVDWRITDALADPEGAEAFHTEQLMRLDDCFLCYAPPAVAPEVARLPVLTKGCITFGSFNNQMKINPGVIAAWSQLLKSVPGAQLIIKSGMLDDDGVAARLRNGFTDEGIDVARVELRPWIAGAREHLASYADIDIALDPFPYNGTTTTCEALWMGVPVVTLIGDRHSGRVGFDLLTRVGLERFAAPDVDGYVRIATALAADRNALVALRAELRERVARSPLCDATRFARVFESALRAAWRQWCESAA